MSSITVRKDLRGRFGSARDQGRRPTCLVFAASDSHAATRQPWSELCCEYLFYAAKQHDKTAPESGARMSSCATCSNTSGNLTRPPWVQFRSCARSGGRPEPFGADGERVRPGLVPQAPGPVVLAQVGGPYLQDGLRPAL